MKRSVADSIAALFILSLLLLPIRAAATEEISTLTFHDLKGGFTVAAENNVTGSDLFSSFKGLMPGDTTREIIEIHNRCEEKKATRLFLRSLPHDEKANPLHPSIAAGEDISSMEDFLSQLTLRIWAQDVLVFQGAANVSWDGSIPLGKIAWGQSTTLQVELSVPITLGNAYAQRMGEIDWVFVTETDEDGSGAGQTLTVRKLWSDGNDAHREDAVTVYLTKNGTPQESAVLSPENQWCFSFGGLSRDADWAVAESTTTKGYTPAYLVDGELVTILNRADEGEPDIPPVPAGPKELRVVKRWAEPNKPHPAYIECTLYREETAVETVRLNEDNHWTYHWSNLDGTANWQVLESNCEGTYIPSYHIQGDGTVIITNTERLLQTGQLHWPIPVLFCLGAVLLASGLWMRRHHEK